MAATTFIITGRQGEGKTTKLLEVIRKLKEKGVDIFGFTAPGEWESGLRSRFYIQNILSGKSHLLCERQVTPHASKDQFVFTKDTLKAGTRWITQGLKQQKKIAVIDEIGWFELEDKVWYPAFKKLLDNNTPALITVREKLLQPVIEKFNLAQPVIFSLEEKNTFIADKILDKIAENEKSGH